MESEKEIKEQLLNQPLIETNSNQLSSNLSDGLGNVSIDNIILEENQQKRTQYSDQGSDCKVPASLTQAKKHFDYSVFGVPKPNPKICPSCLENKKEPFKLTVNLDDTPEANSTENLYMKTVYLYMIVLVFNLIPSLYILYSYQQLYFKTHPVKSRTLSYYFKSIWDFDQNMIHGKDNRDLNDYESILMTANWINLLTIIICSCFISSRVRKQLKNNYERLKHQKPTYYDFSILLPYLKAETSKEDVAEGIQFYLKTTNHPIEQFKVVKIVMIRSLNKQEALASLIMNERAKQKAIQEHLQNTIRTATMKKKFLSMLEDRLKRLKKRVKNLEKKFDQEKLKSDQTKKSDCCAAIVTFATTLQRDLFLSLSLEGINFTKNPEIIIQNNRPISLNLAPPINQIGWSSAGYTKFQASESIREFEIARVILTGFILVLIFFSNYTLKKYPEFKLLSPIISITFSSLFGTLRRFTINRVIKKIIYDVKIVYEKSMMTLFRIPVTLISIGLAIYFSDTEKDQDQINLVCKVFLNYFVIKLGCMPLLTLFPPYEVYKSLRRRFISFRFRKIPESIPMVQKDLDKIFERDQVGIVDLFSKLDYLMFFGITLPPVFPLIGLMSLFTLILLRAAEKYKMLRRYKKIERVNLKAKQGLLAGTVPIYSSFILFRLLVFVFFGNKLKIKIYFRDTWMELLRLFILSMCCVINFIASGLDLTMKEKRDKVAKFGKHASFVQQLTAYNRDESLKQKREFKKIKERELNKEEQKEEKVRVILEGGKERLLHRITIIQKQVKQLNPSDYYSYCELDFEDDYDRANPSSKSIATKLFRKKKLKRLEERGEICLS